MGFFRCKIWKYEQAANEREADLGADTITDQALEAAAGATPYLGGAFSVSLCTVMADCPN